MCKCISAGVKLSFFIFNFVFLCLCQLQMFIRVRVYERWWEFFAKYSYHMCGYQLSKMVWSIIKNVNVCFCSCIRDGDEAIGISYYMERVCVWVWKIAEFLKRYKCTSLRVIK